MGPAAAYNAMGDPDVGQVTLCDMNQQHQFNQSNYRHEP